MRIATMGFVSGLLKESTGQRCEFMRVNGKLPETYWTWEYMETPSMTSTENGYQETTIIVRGFTSGEWLTLEEGKERIEKACAKTAILNDGTGVAVFYDSAMVVPTGDAQLKSIKINLIVQEWKVN